MMIYVMSDIHGNLRRFNSIMKQIDLKEDDTLYVLGDVIDRHPRGIEILLKIMEMSNVKMLLGNHEYMMLNALDMNYNVFYWCSNSLSLWYRNSGKITHQQFELLDVETKTRILDYLKGLPLNIDIKVKGKKYKLVHASPVEFYDEFNFQYSSVEEFAVWNRLTHKIENRDYILIFGHTTTKHYQNCEPMKIWKHENMIGIDCGSGYPESKFGAGGRLACLRLDDMKEYYSEEVYSESVEL